MTDHLFELTTKLSPPRTFLVDDKEYELLGADHLSKEDDAVLTARFSKYGQTATALSIEPDIVRGKQLALQLRDQRIAILTLVTTMPKDVASRLPTKPALTILEAVKDSLDGTLDTGDEEAKSESVEESN